MEDPLSSEPEPPAPNPASVIPIMPMVGGDGTLAFFALAPTRRVAALFGFLPEAQARQVLLTQNFVDAPRDLEAIHSLWDAAYLARKRLPRLAPARSSIEGELPSAFADYEERLVRREDYQRSYQGVWSSQYRVRLVSLKRLITPQYCLNLDYVEELVASAPEPDDLAGALALAFEHRAPVPDPIFDMIGGGSMIFRSPEALLAPVQPLEWRRVGPQEVEVVQRIQLRPNLFQVVRFRPPNGDDLLIVTNGVHRAAALLRKGWEYVPALLRNASQPAELGFNGADPGIFPPNEWVSPRPPCVADLLDPALTRQFQQRVAEHLLKVTAVSE